MTILGKLGYAVSVCFMEPAIILFPEKMVTTIFLRFSRRPPVAARNVWTTFWGGDAADPETAVS